MRTRLAQSTLALLLALLMIATPIAAQAQTTPGSGLLIPVTGTTDAGDRFVGTLTLQRFAVVNNQLVAIGRLTGTLTDAAGNVIANIVRTVVLPVNTQQSNASCEILHLEIGPLDLNLLGLVVHLDRIVLDITAEPGAGNLLGNLLCAIAGLLDGGPLNQLANLLNQLLNLLG